MSQAIAVSSLDGIRALPWIVMRFEWDEHKNTTNLSKHGLDFADAEKLFAGPVLVAPDMREYGEERSGSDSSVIE